MAIGSDVSLSKSDFSEIVADIVSAFVSNNSVSLTELPGLLAAVHSAVSQLAVGHSAPVVQVPLEPAVSVKKSVTREFIVCLEDGKKFKSLRRHLSSAYGMAPDEYRAKWNLPSDYPMVAPAYAERRSQLAKDIGLGTNRAAAKAPVTPVTKATRGRPKKAA